LQLICLIKFVIFVTCVDLHDVLIINIYTSSCCFILLLLLSRPEVDVPTVTVHLPVHILCII